ncbi:MAG: 50S ribosomal protein L13 [Planctomycetota bacterium]|jgi:large subunit ribosomal protein L13
MIKTFIAKKEDVQRDWYVIDATDKVLGRMASRIAMILQGKTKPIYTPHVDTGDFVVVTNAEKIKLTGNKINEKVYYTHSGYPGGFKEIPIKKWMEKHPDRIVNLAVKRMLPKTKLGSAMLKKLKVYAGSDHSHEAQQPKTLEI